MIRYRLDDLGFIDFEWLCQSLLKASFGLAIESWGGTSDRGRDAYYDGPLKLTKGRPQPGPFVFQAKFVSGANAAGARPLPSIEKAIKSELQSIQSKIAGLDWQDPKHYVLLTNVPLSATARSKLSKLLQTTLPKCKTTCFNATDICDLLDHHPDLRASFPQLLGIRDLDALLSGVVNRATRTRSRAAVSQANRLSTVFYPTKAYESALQTLHTHSFAVLTGPPEIGKTSIGRMIGLAKHSLGWQYLECRTPEDFFSNCDDSSPQVFLADDAFGSTEYDPPASAAWGQSLALILDRLGPKRWFIWTSRPTPFAMALKRLHLQGPAEQFPKPASVEVNAANLSKHEKAMMLFRHAKAAALSAELKTLLRSNSRRIIFHSSFTPERIRRLVSRFAQLFESLSQETDAETIEAIIAHEIEQPSDGMMKSFEALHPDYKGLLIAMLDATSSPPSREELIKAFERLRGNKATLPAEKVASELEGHFIERCDSPFTLPSSRKELNCWRWIHPSGRDLVIDYLTQHRRAREEFLKGCGTSGLSLALSVGGGAKGNRSLPLLQDEGDWKILSGTVVRQIRDGGVGVIGKILDVIVNSNDLAEVEDDPVVRDRFTELRKAITHSVVKAWDSGDGPASVRLLRRFYEMSLSVRPLPKGPQLERVWEDSLNAIDFYFAPSAIGSVAQDVEEFLELVETIKENEPRFLTQVGFPEAFVEQFEELVERMGQHVVPDIDRNSSELDDELGVLAFICEASMRIDRLSLANASSIPIEFEDERRRLGRMADGGDDEDSREPFSIDRGPTDFSDSDIDRLFGEL